MLHPDDPLRPSTTPLPAGARQRVTGCAATPAAPHVPDPQRVADPRHGTGGQGVAGQRALVAGDRRRRWARGVGLAVSLALLAAACGGTGELEVTDARSRMSPMLTGVGAVYLDIVNDTAGDDRLLTATVPAEVAGRVEIHETFDAEAGEGAHAGEDHGDMASQNGDAGEDHAGMNDPDDSDDHAGSHAADGPGFAMMGMREVDHLDVPAGTTVTLVPGGYHLMLLDLTTDLVPGTTFPLTLTFATAGEVTVTVEVREDV